MTKTLSIIPTRTLRSPREQIGGVSHAPGEANTNKLSLAIGRDMPPTRSRGARTGLRVSDDQVFQINLLILNKNESIYTANRAGGIASDAVITVKR